MNQVRLLRCDILPTSSPGVVASLGSLGQSSPLGFLFFFCVVLLRIRGFCELEFEKSAQQQPVWSHVFIVFLYFEFISRLDALHSVLNSLYLHTLPMSKLHQHNRFFFVGSWPYTLACKARPSFDWCGTSLSVSLSLSNFELRDKFSVLSSQYVFCVMTGRDPWCGSSRIRGFTYHASVMSFVMDPRLVSSIICVPNWRALRWLFSP